MCGGSHVYRFINGCVDIAKVWVGVVRVKKGRGQMVYAVFYYVCIVYIHFFILLAFFC